MLIDVSKMSHAAEFDLVTVGHLSIDTIISPKTTRPITALGGPPAYASVAAARLGAKVSIISNVGEDFPNKYAEWLQSNRVDLTGLKRVSNASTTRFVLEYKNWERKLRLSARAPPILPSDISESLRTEIVHVAPIANEIPSEVVAKLRMSAKVLSLDPQGFVRSFDKEGNVGLKSWREPEVLAQVDVFKSSTEEIQAITDVQDLKSAMKQIGAYGMPIVMVTKGIKGSALFFEEQYYEIPQCKSRTVVDPTGAGDAFIGAFLAEYLRVKDVLWCVCVGSAAASFVVEGFGPERSGERHEVYERANGIYEKVAGKR